MPAFKTFSGANTDGSFAMAVLNSLLSLLEKNIAACLGKFWVIFIFILKIEETILLRAYNIASC